MPQGESRFSLQHSHTVLSTLWDGARGVSQPPALKSKFEDGVGIFIVCFLCYQTPPKRHFLQSHLDLCNIPCYIYYCYTPVILGEFSLFPACCASSFPCACCHTACEQDAAVWSLCGSCTLGLGGWNGSCTLNKRSLKAVRYLPLPWGWELMDTALEGLWLPSEQLSGAQGKLFRSFRSGAGVRVYPRVSE